MASVSSSKKKLSQQELRRLMSKHKDKFVESIKKIDSPLAKYTKDGSLMCVLCNTVVRSESVWNVHINAKAHRDNIQNAKQKKIAPEFRRPVVAPITESLKRPSSAVTSDPIPPKKIRGILKNAPPQPVSTSLPGDFFDSEAPASTNQVAASTQSTTAPVEEIHDREDTDLPESNGDADAGRGAEVLPEGFFDDPIMDAKARHVEYKDPIEEEWERFQKEIKEEVTVSSQIIEEDHEEATAERQIEEIDEQLRNWNRVLEIEQRKEAVRAAERIRMEVDEDVSSGEEDFDEFLDWRAKKSYQ